MRITGRSGDRNGSGGWRRWRGGRGRRGRGRTVAPETDRHMSRSTALDLILFVANLVGKKSY